jgi:hypothetical protein
VFAASATGQLRGAAAFRGFEESARSMGVPARLSRLVAVAVVVGECAAVVLLALGPGGAPGFVLTLLLLAAFTTGIVRSLRSGTKASCACFGASTAPIGRRHVVRNTVLLKRTTVPWLSTPVRPWSVSLLKLALKLSAAW